MRPRRRLIGIAIAVLAASVVILPASAAASRAKKPWPPVPDRGKLFAHYGEEHLDDDDGIRIFPHVIRDSARYRPDAVTASGDKASDNSVENLTGWKEQMGFYDGKGIPYYPAVGNHDRSQPGTEGIGSVFNGGDISNYVEIFADRPYPFGDAPPVVSKGFEPSTRPPTDPAGASTYYAIEIGSVRWIFLDNSCFSFLNCDPYQNPTLPDQEGNPTQYDFMRAQATLATRENDLAFVVMHMPTQDPRPGHSQPTPSAHNMGEGSSPENGTFEEAAAAAGVDGVFAGHIKGQWIYSALEVPYFIDGGAGGEVYVGSGEETGVDSGYWHGFRLMLIRKGRVVVTDTVPVFADGGITVDGPSDLPSGEVGDFSAIGQQPTEEGPDVKLELRNPSDEASNFENLPTPARIWTTSDRRVLAPVAAEEDDPRRNKRTQTVSGRFRARCPGFAYVTVTSGWEKRRLGVEVADDGDASAGCRAGR